MNGNNLQIGEIYDTIIIRANEEYKGKSLYIGKKLKRDIVNRHIMVFDAGMGIEAYAFKDYTFENRELRVTSTRQLHPSLLERKYLTNQLKKALSQNK